ncbi:aminoglycoside phosphotransferase family protein [Candidatus Paracaedibacter symbiosus]|uniref:aminoglycoside phosphotransferase family protein n=1 Tax=Candidatus Paracaedibacter symbiosus TaxID=244582 RepID=UPI00068C290A|nr:phosphotransferase [Candidatus Paracaedibacter symbiosus]
MASKVREQQRQAFLVAHNYDPEHLVFLAGDASPRQYYRWQQDGKSVVLMDTPLSEKPEQFCKLATTLYDRGLSAPAILATDFDNGFILLEDFGDQTYTRALTSENTPALYRIAVDALIHLHRNFVQKEACVSEYTAAELLREALLFLDWYYPATQDKEASSATRKSYESLWQQAFTIALRQQPSSLVLRDYHVDNLMLLPGRDTHQQCGLLDFQDALWGPVGYDLVSLVEDARRDVNPALKEALWQQYGAAFPELDLELLRRSSAVISAGRHLKILGIFTRLAIGQGKKHYLSYLPRVWRLLEISLAEAKLPNLTAWFSDHVTQWSIPHVD